MNSSAPLLATAAANRVLVVDDEESMRELLQVILEQVGFSVVTVDGPPRAFEIIRDKEFAVIISDYRMKPIDGLEFLKIVSHMQPRTSRLMVTGFADVQLMVDAINDGQVYRFMMKPFVRDELLGAVRDASQRYQDFCRAATLEMDVASMNEELKRVNASLAEQLAQDKEQKRELERLNHALQGNLQRCVDLCLHVLETFHPSLGVNARRVQALCTAIGQDLHLPVEQRHVLEISALLHDIGMIGMHRDLIHRWQGNPQALSDAEQSLIRQHPIIGQELVTFADDLKDVGTLIRHHHEHHDGSGYPDGLRGEEISWLARLLAVAASYTEHHHGGPDAAHAISAARGTRFDPEAVRVLLRALPQAVLPKEQRGHLLRELQPGMVLASPVYNYQGVLILPEGRPLNEEWITKLKAHDQVSPLNQFFQVYA
jgi:response regulator RpfG family c-di-GMP phosphodiesterase